MQGAGAWGPGRPTDRADAEGTAQQKVIEPDCSEVEGGSVVVVVVGGEGGGAAGGEPVGARGVGGRQLREGHTSLRKDGPNEGRQMNWRFREAGRRATRFYGGRWKSCAEEP